MTTANRQRAKYIALAGIGIAPFLVNGWISAKISPWPNAYWAFDVFIWIAIPIAVLTFLARNAGLRFEDLGFRRTIFGRRSVVLVVLACLFFCMFDYGVYTEAYGYMRYFLSDNGIFNSRSVIPDADPGHSLVLLYLALTAGIVEEIYFRGLLFKIATFVPGTVPVFLLVSPLLFAAVHWESGMASTAASYIFGLVTSIVYVLMRNIWPLIVGHVYTDFVVFGLNGPLSAFLRSASEWT